MTIKNTNILIIGAGPAGIFTAYELIEKGYEGKITLIEKGVSIDKRHCPKDKTGICVNCKPYCHITTGFSGAGAFSDGKLSLVTEVGGDLPSHSGASKVQGFIDYTDQIYLKFGADEKIEGIENTAEIKEIRRKAISASLKLVDCPIRHLGTEKAQEIYLDLQNYLLENEVDIHFGTLAEDFIIEAGAIKGAIITDSKSKKNSVKLMADQVIVATGRKGSDWLFHMCQKHGINQVAGPIDIGVRVEVRNEVMESVNNVLYESKLIGYPNPFGDKVRTFCQNPGGFVSQENYDEGIAIVNGHSYKELKSNNTNLAILSSHHFTEPFNQPTEYGKMTAKLVNMLGNGAILVQRYGDILEGKRTWQHELDRSNVTPTLKDAVAGDLTSSLPYRTMTNILNFIEALDKVVPGFASRETLLYGPEIKFYSNRITLNDNFETNIKGLYALGDSSGWTRGLMMASAMGVMMGRYLVEKK
ncbi:MAG: FAD-dependent oxidoreductase [Clostridiales bacterium 38-18]|nr:MAG: FAD-dependent oxidoreductase [Clostridiales bacterium 38-18]